MLIPAVTGFGRVARAVFVSAVGAAIVIEAIGAFWYTGASDAAYCLPPLPSRIPCSPGECETLRSLRNSSTRAPFELTTGFRGSVDLIQIGYGAEGREISVDDSALPERAHAIAR